MITDFDYNELPASYTLCLYEGCPRATQCLRCALGLGVPAERTQIRILSPAAARRLAGDQCPHFRPIVKYSYARGIESLLRQLRSFPYDDAVWIKDKVYNFFGRWKYYEIKHGDRLVTPEEQAEIRKYFLKRGITAEPSFDERVEQFSFV